MAKSHLSLIVTFRSGKLMDRQSILARWANSFPPNFRLHGVKQCAPNDFSIFDSFFSPSAFRSRAFLWRDVGAT
jgi:hypothetical protein